MIFNMVGGGGAGGASIFIVNSVNQRPANVFNNTLWVNTDVDVVKYVFSDNEPSNPTEGMLWLTISNSDNVNVAAPINKDWMKFNLGIVRQYIDGVWERKLAQLYKDGIWVDVSKIFVAYIDITYPANSNCVVTNSSGQTVANDTNATSSPQTFTAIVGATGTYTVTATATDGTNTKSQSVSITTEGQSVSVELLYRYYLFKEGSGAQNGFTFNATNPSVFSISDSKIIFNTNTALNNVVSVTPTIDLSAYSVLSFELKCTGRYNGSGSGYDVTFGVGSNAPISDSNPGAWTAKLADIYDESRKVYSVDVSSVSSAQYVKFWAYATTGEIYNLWLE